MKAFRRYGSALMIAGVMSGVLMATTAPLEAAGKKGDGRAAICSYLKQIIDYPYTHPTIKLWAEALYDRYDCAA